MTASDLLHILESRGVAVRADGDRLRLSPAKELPASIVDELRRRKPEILALLAESKSRPVTAADRLAGYDSAVADANRRYRGRSIDWPAVDAAAERIHSACTHKELDAAVRSYVSAVGDSSEPTCRS